jgi:hypothetical protein
MKIEIKPSGKEGGGNSRVLKNSDTANSLFINFDLLMIIKWNIRNSI